MLHSHAQGQLERRVEPLLLVWHRSALVRPWRLGLAHAPHRCARVRVAVLETTAVNVIIKDQDDVGEDDLIGVACTSVHGGSRWLDLIRQGTSWVSGAVKLQLVFKLQSPSGVVLSPFVAGYSSVNSTGGADPKASCPAGYAVTDCTCKAIEPDSGECAYLRFSANEQACSSPGANAQTVLGARCVNVNGVTLSNVASTQDSGAVAAVRRGKRHAGLGRVGEARGAAGVRQACTPPTLPFPFPTLPPLPAPGDGDGELCCGLHPHRLHRQPDLCQGRALRPALRRARTLLRRQRRHARPGHATPATLCPAWPLAPRRSPRPTPPPAPPCTPLAPPVTTMPTTAPVSLPRGRPQRAALRWMVRLRPVRPSR